MYPRDPPSFTTRRSSDLGKDAGAEKKKDQPKAQAQSAKRGQGAGQQKEKKAKPNQAGGSKKVSQPDRKVDPAFERAADEIGRAHGLNSSHLVISYAVFCL